MIMIMMTRDCVEQFFHKILIIPPYKGRQGYGVEGVSGKAERAKTFGQLARFDQTELVARYSQLVQMVASGKGGW